MATRKKKDPGTLSGLPKDYPCVSIGTHLTVIEYEDGRTELEWDDDQLLKEVREALATAGDTSKKFDYSEPKEIVTENGDKALEVIVTKKAPKKAKAK